jgi:hypothetical protein
MGMNPDPAFKHDSRARHSDDWALWAGRQRTA